MVSIMSKKWYLEVSMYGSVLNYDEHVRGQSKPMARGIQIHRWVCLDWLLNSKKMR
jgi:hypothetical protein